MASAGDWCLIESDPGVFSELIRSYGVEGVQVEELYCLDLDHLREFKPVHGLIFLFKYRPGEESSGTVDPSADHVYFAQQVINNACATQAIINLLLNTEDPNIKLGSILENFRNFSSGLDPANRGLCLSNLHEIRSVHNSFARANFMELDSGKHGKDEAFHFVTYVPVKGRVYELDGLKDAPIDLGPIPEGSDWLDVVHEVLNARVQRHTANEITCNLMAVVNDRIQTYMKRLAEIENESMETEETSNEICRLQMLVNEEEEKRTGQKNENARRRHNYTPFIMELLKLLAKEGKLVPLVEKAISEEEKRAAAKKEVTAGSS